MANQSDWDTAVIKVGNTENDWNSLPEQLEKLISDPAKIANLIEAGKSIFHELFDSGSLFLKILTIDDPTNLYRLRG
jgi:hypothetical protein